MPRTNRQPLGICKISFSVIKNAGLKKAPSFRRLRMWTQLYTRAYVCILYSSVYCCPPKYSPPAVSGLNVNLIIYCIYVPLVSRSHEQHSVHTLICQH